jgi:hypothetical protein
MNEQRCGMTYQNVQDQDVVRLERRAMEQLLCDCIDAMRTTQRLFSLSDNHLLMLRCREVERWMDENESARVDS